MPWLWLAGAFEAFHLKLPGVGLRAPVSRLCELRAPAAPPWRREVSLLVLIVVLAVVVGAFAVWRRSEVTTIYPPFTGLLYRDGRFVRDLPPGRYAWLDLFGRNKVVQVSLAGLPAAPFDVTVLSKDQFSFRLALVPVIKVVDARLFVESQPYIEAQQVGVYMSAVGSHPALHPTVAAAAFLAAGSRTLARIVASPAELTAEVQASVSDAISGAAIEQILLTAVNLPPETRRMFTEVERAKMEAQSALERARGEQAALRVLANAARLVNDNPGLANLRLLQTIEASKGSTTIILGDAVASPGGFPAKPRATAS